MKFQLVNFCEFDKYATQSYCAIHNEPESKNLGDITKVNVKEIADFNMMVGGSPCQDFSVAGKQKGAVWTCKDCGHEYNPLEAHYSTRDKCPKCFSTNIEKTRSSLLVEWLRVLREKKPNLAIYENVKNIIGKQFKSTFDLFEKELQDYGYNTYWKVLIANEYGIPQTRSRVYLVIIKKELDNGKFKFPKGFDNGIKLLDMLEETVDNKYYLNQTQLNKILNSDFIQEARRIQGNVCETLLARDYKDPKCVRLGGVFDTDKSIHQAGSIYDKNFLSPTLDTAQGGWRQPCVIDDNINVRKLTPLEYWRLMGFKDEDFYKAKNSGISDSQLYKQAGNSIVVDVLYYILLEIYKVMPYLLEDVKLSSFFSGIGAFEKAIVRLQNYVNNINACSY